MAFDFTQATVVEPKFKVVGIGEAGNTATYRLHEMHLAGLDLAVVSTIANDTPENLPRPHLERICPPNPGEIERVIESVDFLILLLVPGDPSDTAMAARIAATARDREILTVVIAARPFSFEGPEKVAHAEHGVEHLLTVADSVLAFSSDRLLDNQREGALPPSEAFLRRDETFEVMVRMLTEIVISPGLIAVDFADVKTILRASGRATAGFGLGYGEVPGNAAIQAALGCSLLERPPALARGILIWSCSKGETTVENLSCVLNNFERFLHPEANILCSLLIDEALPARTHAFGFVATDFRSTLATKGASGDDPEQNCR